MILVIDIFTVVDVARYINVMPASGKQVNWEKDNWKEKNWLNIFVIYNNQAIISQVSII